MKRLFLAAMALALPACTTLGTSPGIPGNPAAVANQTVLDEQAGLAITLAYNTANRLGLLAIRSGFAKGAVAEKIKLLDAQAFGWVQRVRTAYEAGNSDSYTAAVIQARAVIAELNRLAG